MERLTTRVTMMEACHTKLTNLSFLNVFLAYVLFDFRYFPGLAY